MKSLLALLLIFGGCYRAVAEELISEQQQSAAARAILEKWQQEQPETAERFLHIVCWTPADRELPKEYQARLTRIMKHIQAFYGAEMERHGFGYRTFNLRFDRNENLILHLVRGTHPTNHYGLESGGEIRKECIPVLKKAGIDPDRETIVIFCNLAEWDEQQLKFRHFSPYYAGGSHRSGTAWQLDSPELDIPNLSLKQPIIQDGQYGRISLGKHNSIFIGGIAHELGHALGLPHCTARPDETLRGTLLMGSGNRTYGDELRNEGKGTILSYAHALRLASHPQFSESVKGLNTPATASVEQLAIESRGKAIEVSGIIKGDIPIYGVVAYFDPEGHGDYDATTATAVPAKDGRFTLRTEALQPGNGVLRLYPLHCNGAVGDPNRQSRLRFSYRISAEGTPDLTTVQTLLALAPCLEALNQGNRDLARKLAAELSSKPVAELALRLIDPRSPTQTPAQYDGRATTVELTSLKPTSAQVGWIGPTYDRLPEAPLLLESGGEIFSFGIYAHAPARHEYSLGEKWQTLKGQVGIATGHSGSVVFEIKGDGQTLWRSEVVRPDQLVEFQVKVLNVRQLELLTSPTPDGNSNDWGLWLAPQLLRE